MNQPQKSFLRNCPILERTADGRAVGRCWFYVDDNGCCERHGNVREALRTYRETGKLTDEREHVKKNHS